MSLFYQTDADGFVCRVISQPDHVAAEPEGFARAPDGMGREALKRLRRVGDGWEIAPMPEPDTREDVAAMRLARARRTAQEDLIAWLDAQAEAVSGKVPAAEKHTWDAKEAAAKAVLAGSPSPEEAQLLGIEAMVVGESLPALAAKVATNAVMFRLCGPLLAAVRRRAQARIDAAGTVEEVEAVAEDARALFSAIMADPQGFAADPRGWLAKWKEG